MTRLSDFERLRTFVAEGARLRCHRCHAPLEADHPHLAEIVERGLACVCGGCYDAAHDGARYRRVPRDIASLPGLAAEREWEAVPAPVGLFFILHSSTIERFLMCYPGAAGVVESELTLPVRDAPRLAAALDALAPDVEALLVRADRGSREVLRVPIDLCYSLAGIVRRNWRGFDGGEARTAIDEFFRSLHRRATPAVVEAGR
jgi:hypothetical protein